jgi:hypothetical protein
VRTEATLADRNRTHVPCMIELCERPIMFKLTQTAEPGHRRRALYGLGRLEEALAACTEYARVDPSLA